MRRSDAPTIPTLHAERSTGWRVVVLCRLVNDRPAFGANPAASLEAHRQIKDPNYYRENNRRRNEPDVQHKSSIQVLLSAAWFAGRLLYSL
jgi:hypothetical protein